MISRFLVLLAAFALTGLPSCGSGDPYEELMQESVKTMDELGRTLAKITDQATFDQHSATLEALITKAKSFDQRSKDLGEPSKERQAELEQAMRTQMETAGIAMGKEINRIMANPEIQASLLPLLQQMTAIAE